jgi:hypothetical protein
MFLINVSLLILAFLGTILAIGGDTWKHGSITWWRRITTRGWISITCLVASLGLGIVKEVATTMESAKLQEAKDTLQQQLDLVPKTWNVRSWQPESGKKTYKAGARFKLISKHCDFWFFHGPLQGYRSNKMFSPEEVYLDYPPNDSVVVEVKLESGSLGRCDVEFSVSGVQV